MDYHSNDIIIDPIKSYISLNSLTESPMSAFFKLKSLHLLSSSPTKHSKKFMKYIEDRGGVELISNFTFENLRFIR